MPDLDLDALERFLDDLRPGDVVLAAGDRAVVKHIYSGGRDIALVQPLSGADAWVCEFSQIEAPRVPDPSDPRCECPGCSESPRESATVDDAPHGDDMSPEEIMDYEG